MLYPIELRLHAQMRAKQYFVLGTACQVGCRAGFSDRARMRQRSKTSPRLSPGRSSLQIMKQCIGLEVLLHTWCGGSKNLSTLINLNPSILQNVPQTQTHDPAGADGRG